jgi:hypothetical protein
MLNVNAKKKEDDLFLSTSRSVFRLLGSMCMWKQMCAQKFTLLILFRVQNEIYHHALWEHLKSIKITTRIKHSREMVWNAQKIWCPNIWELKCGHMFTKMQVHNIQPLGTSFSCTYLVQDFSWASVQSLNISCSGKKYN